MIHVLDIGGSGIKSAYATDAQTITPVARLTTPLDDFDAFVGAVAAALGGAPASDGPIAISITGVIDPEAGIITCANIPCIDGRNLAGDLSARFGRKVLVANDADCFVLAEAGIGAGRGHRVVFGAILGTGVGGGLVIDGKLHVGAGGLTGEWGHGPAAANFAGTPRVDIPLYACGCGQTGCVDTIGAARGLERLHLHLFGESLPSTEIVARWRAGDADAARTVDCQVDLVASPLALTVNITGASIVPVGGGMSNVPELIALIDERTRARILRKTDRPLVVPGACRVEPGLIGATILALSGAAA